VGLVVVETKKNEGSVVFRELVDGAIDFGCKLGPWVGGDFHGIEGSCGLFPLLAADLGANVIHGGTVCFAVEPGGEGKGGRNVWGLFDEPQEDGLGDVAGCFVISSNAPGD